MSLNGKSAFITGASGGIGRPLIKRLESAGVRINAYDQDKRGDLVRNFASVVDELTQDTPDILINLAGINQFACCEAQNYQRLIDLNLIVPMTLAQAVLPEMRKRGTGHIVNIGSMVAEIPMPYLTGYVASKAGLNGFSDALRREISGQGITVTHINPRAVRTTMNHGAMATFNEMTRTTEDSPDWVAEQIFQAINNRVSRKSLGRKERFFSLTNALLPGMVDVAMRKQKQVAEQVLFAPNHASRGE